MEVWSVEAVLRTLQEAGVRYLLVGGLAVVAHGYERMTRDLGGLLVPVVALDTRLQLKCQAGRPQDLADVEALQETAAWSQTKTV